MNSGIRANLSQFVWLTVNVALVGATLGVERTVVPLLGHDVYHVAAAVSLMFISSFGLTKALINMAAGRWSDRVGRLTVLRLGWIAGVPMVLILLTIHQWWAVIVANVFLGANQGLAWTMTVTAQLDLVAPHERGLAMGINEAMGYIGVAVATIWAGALGQGGHLQTRPFVLDAALVAIGGAMSFKVLRETRHPAPKQGNRVADTVPFGTIFADTTWRNPALSSITAGGLINKLADTAAWGVLPIYFASQHLTLATISLLSGIYGGVWGLGQFGTGVLSDRVGRKPLVVGGLTLLGGGMVATVVVHGVADWGAMAVIMGMGMAMVYPVLNAAVADVAPAAERGSVLGVYRLWRDGGYAIGGVILGPLVVMGGMRHAIELLGVLVLGVSALIGLRMPETHSPRGGRGTQDRSAEES